MAWVFNIVSPVRGYHKFTVPEIKVLRGGVSDRPGNTVKVYLGTG